jgi:hypothetical protein
MNTMKNFLNYLDSYEVKYNMFVDNREYRTRSFKDDEDFKRVQFALAEEIDLIDKEVKKESEKIIKEVFPDVEIVAYDSRFFKKGQAKLGNFLCKGVKDLEEARTIQKYFESITYTNILITRWEDLDEDTQKNFL